MKKTSLAIAALVLVLAGPAVARAQDNSAIDQYTENVPGADGGSGSPGGAGGGSGSGPSGSSDAPAPAPELPQESSDALGAAGDEGAAAADLAQSTAPEGAGDRENGTDAQGAGADRSLGDKGDGTAETSAAPAAEETDSGGGVPLLPIILGAILLAAIGFAIVQRLRRRGDGRVAAGPTA